MKTLQTDMLVCMIEQMESVCMLIYSPEMKSLRENLTSGKWCLVGMVVDKTLQACNTFKAHEQTFN